MSISCGENSNSSTKSTTTKAKTMYLDSITSVDIYYYPSFINSSVLRLNRITGEGIFQVDTTIGFNYVKPDTLYFPLSDIESQTDIKFFWRSSFIYSIRQDTSMLGWTDGMPIFVKFTNNKKMDSVYLGNVSPKAVDSILMRQILYLEKKADNSAMKEYLIQLKEYL